MLMLGGTIQYQGDCVVPKVPLVLSSFQCDSAL
jgi:hypothetical protein